jgi:hypothetical protein
MTAQAEYGTPIFYVFFPWNYSAHITLRNDGKEIEQAPWVSLCSFYRVTAAGVPVALSSFSCV